MSTEKIELGWTRMEIGGTNWTGYKMESIAKRPKGRSRKKLKNRVVGNLYELVKKNDKGLSRGKDRWRQVIVATISPNGL